MNNPDPMRAFVFLFFLTGSMTLLNGQSYTVKTVPNTKLVDGSYVSNPDFILSASTVANIDSILLNLENKTSAQVAVVLLNSIAEQDPFDFAQELFEEWKIGNAKSDNGLLVLFVKDKRTVRFHTGDGIEGLLPDAMCKRIQREKMVPSFKEENYDEGMLQGIVEVNNILSNPDNVSETAGIEEIGNVTEEEIHLYNLTTWIVLAWIIVTIITFLVKLKRKTFAKSTQNAVVPQARFSAGMWILWYLFIPVVFMIALTVTDNAGFFFGGMYAYAGVSLMAKRKLMDQEATRWIMKKEYQAVYNFFQQEKGLFSFMRFLFPLPFLFSFGQYKKRMEFFRNHPRNCKQCNAPLSKLDEVADDAHLTKSQLMEEALQSIDYDIWKCSACNASDKLSYLNPSSKYQACPKCQVKSYFKVSNSVVRSATTSNEGIGEEINSCKFCGERNVRRYSIARITTSSSSSSSGGSSSGGSWGGGSSGGGGASSSW